MKKKLISYICKRVEDGEEVDLFLHGFIKKANKDYVKEVEKAMEILRRLL